VAKVDCISTFKYSPMRGVQVIKEARRRNCLMAPAWSAMGFLLGLILPRRCLLGGFFQC